MDRTRNLDAKLFARDPSRPEMTPLSILHDDVDEGGVEVSKMIVDLLRRGNSEIALRAIGPDAEKASEVLRSLFDSPIPSFVESLSATKAWRERSKETRERKRRNRETRNRERGERCPACELPASELDHVEGGIRAGRSPMAVAVVNGRITQHDVTAHMSKCISEEEE